MCGAVQILLILSNVIQAVIIIYLLRRGNRFERTIRELVRRTA